MCGPPNPTRSPAPCPRTCCAQAVERDLRIQDDATIIVVDMLPHERTSFPTVVLLARPEGARKAKKAKSSSGGMFGCFKAEVEQPDSRDAEGLGHLQVGTESGGEERICALNCKLGVCLTVLYHLHAPFPPPS